MSTLRRIACIRWFPPMLSASPSPVVTQTSRAGLAILMPVAMAGARPWIACTP